MDLTPVVLRAQSGMTLLPGAFQCCYNHEGTRPFPAMQEDIADVEQAPAIVGIIEEANMPCGRVVLR